MLVPIPPLMPDKVSAPFDVIKADVVNLHAKWTVYRQLFATSDADRAFLESAHNAFALIHESMVADIVMTLSRLSDPARQGRFANLSLGHLALALVNVGHAELADEVRAKANSASLACGEARKVRDKTLAHRDLDIALGGAAAGLPRLSRQKIEEALKAVRECLNEVELHFRQGRYPYESIQVPLGGDILMSRLKRAAAYDRHAESAIFDPRKDDIWAAEA
jgi:hypothetical protein